MIRPCAVVNHVEGMRLMKICRPGYISSSRMPIEACADQSADQREKRYIVPMSLWWSK